MQLLIIKINRAAVMGIQQIEAHHIPRELAQNITQQEEIAQRFAHFLIVHRDKAVMQPIAGKAAAAGRLGLGDLVLVMREHQIGTTAVNIKAVPQVFAAHSRTFDMPAGATHTPRAFPRRFTRLGGLPQGEIHRIFLLITDLHTRTCQHIIQITAGELAVIGEFLHRKINIAVYLISEAFGHQRAYQINDLLHMPGNSGVDVGRQYIQCLGVLEIRGDILLCHISRRDAFLRRTTDDLVIHVGKILHIGHIKPGIFEIPPHRIKNHDRAGITQVNIIVNRRSADVHRDLAGRSRHEIDLVALHSVVNLNSHPAHSFTASVNLFNAQFQCIFFMPAIS